MTENEIIEEALKAVPEYMATIRMSGVFDVDRCVRHYEFKEIEKLFRQEKGLPRLSPLSVQQKAELERIQAYFAGRLTERTQEIKQRYLKGRKVREINAITAKALITSAFADAGMEAKVSAQRYRACVMVNVAKGRYLRMYVRYRDLSDPDLMDKVLSAVADLKDVLERLGPGACVKIAPH